MTGRFNKVYYKNRHRIVYLFYLNKFWIYIVLYKQNLSYFIACIKQIKYLFIIYILKLGESRVEKYIKIITFYNTTNYNSILIEKL